MNSKCSIILFLLCYIATMVFGGPSLIIDKKFSPPEDIPAYKERIYSVSVGHIISQPIIAKLVDDDNNTITNTSGLTFSIESVDDGGSNTDTFATEGANLCQYANRREYPNSYDFTYYKYYCNESHPSMVIEGIPVYDGILRADGLYHLSDDMGTNNRTFTITLIYEGETLLVKTNRIEVTIPAHSIYVEAITSTVVANGITSFRVTILDKNGSKITTGIDSALTVRIEIASLPTLQWFRVDPPHEDMLAKTKVRLAGSNIKKSRSTDSLYWETQFDAGGGEILNFKFLDSNNCVKLNATARMPNFPHFRQPNTYNDLTKNKQFVKMTIGGKKTNVYYFDGTSDGAVGLSPCVKVTPQTATALKVITPTADIKNKIGANFPIEEEIIIEVVDSSGERIYSGADSKLTVTVTTVPASACISSELKSLRMIDGRVKVDGSICAPISSVTLTFNAESALSRTALTTVSVGPIEVTNDIHLAAFYYSLVSGSGSYTGAFSNSFAEYAVEDIKAGKFPDILPNRTLTLHSINTDNSRDVATKELSKLLDDGKKEPVKRLRGIIGCGSNFITDSLAPLLKLNKIPNIATNEDANSFSEKSVYPYYNRLSWNMAEVAHSVLMSCKNRGWMHMTLVRTTDFTIDNMFFEKARHFGITISAEVKIPIVSKSTYWGGIFSAALKEVEAAGTRIVWMFVMPPTSHYFIRDVINAEMGGINGWQWNMLGIFGLAYPWSNQGPTCIYGTLTCSQGMVGSMSWIVGYDMTMHTTLWKDLLSKHLHSFRNDYRGTKPTLPFTQVLAEYSLAYDAVRVFGMAMSDLIKENKTITGSQLAEQIRKVKMNESLTGNLKFDAKGDRPGYVVVIINVNPHSFITPDNTTVEASAMVVRRIVPGNDSSTQYEYNMQAKGHMETAYKMEVANYTIAYAKYTNKRKYNGSTGRVGTWTMKLEPLPSSGKTEATPTEITEESVAPFFCPDGCGGQQKSIYDIGEYEKGHCQPHNTCKCNAGYTGYKCQDIFCSIDCGNGRCSSPDECKCFHGYVGKRCSVSIYVILLVTIVSVTLLVFISYYLYRFIPKKFHMMQALKSLDWLVKWDDVVVGDTGADNHERFGNSNKCIWKSHICYFQKFDCDTLYAENEQLRVEVVSVRELHHRNLITLVGACLDYPNVCVLTDFAPKGSLEDLLSNDSVKLGWDFKFSILKDICHGMNFLHRSDVQSHGRLTSSNCLIDNRWTCKLTGFGLPTLRYNGRRRMLPYDDIPPKNLSSLFWTAPELLEEAKTIDDIKHGTKLADVYSFGIILSEVCTREEPYSSELKFLTPAQVLILIKDKDDPIAERPKMLWARSGTDTSKSFRPNVKDESLPDQYLVKSGLLELMGQCWDELPEVRPSFKRVTKKLKKLFPVKGKLNDNLVAMLEKYSSNLERTVSIKTKELVEEKHKSDELISQMLPKQVVENLKHGNPVEPESFDCVTILFSDIAGFTTIAKESTPFQVVGLLNDLYKTFDSILNHYDVYKVETIGDTYMVVSGLPIRNGDLHAGEIATIALDVISSMVGFKIKHMKGKKLQLRVGIHSGPVVAGVVGLKIPRYCLFGETVNTTALMESSSMASKIHTSDDCAQILLRLGGYRLESRGETEIKGKGLMKTWWLQGKDGYSKPLPRQ